MHTSSNRMMGSECWMFWPYIFRGVYDNADAGLGHEVLRKFAGVGLFLARLFARLSQRAGQHDLDGAVDAFMKGFRSAALVQHAEQLHAKPRRKRVKFPPHDAVTLHGSFEFEWDGKLARGAIEFETHASDVTDVGTRGFTKSGVELKPIAPGAGGEE